MSNPMKGVGLLASLLMLVLSTGAVAQSPSPAASPEATPSFAPDDLASLLPRRIGEAEMAVACAGGEALVGMFGLDAVQSLLVPLGKDPSDVRLAMASTGRQVGVARLNVIAVRVGGIAAMSIAESMMSMELESILGPALQGVSDEWRYLEGREVLHVVFEKGPDDCMAFYPKGEVLFFVMKSGEPPLDVLDVLAALP